MERIICEKIGGNTIRFKNEFCLPPGHSWILIPIDASYV